MNGIAYINGLKRVGHHGDEHVEEHDDRRAMVHDEKTSADILGEEMSFGNIRILHFCDRKQRPQ